MEKTPRKKTRKNKASNEVVQKAKFKNDNNLKDFRLTNYQRDCLNVVAENKITFIDSFAGVGKSTTALYYACKEYLNDPSKSIVIVRSPTEMGRDNIGYLPASFESKIAVHMESTRIILESFLGKGKVENDLGKRIYFTIPNFALGHTRKNCIYIIEEAQVLEPLILKLLLERIGENTKTLVLGSSGQLYAKDKYGRNALADALQRFFDDKGNPLYPNIAKYKFPIDAIMRDDVVKDVIRAYDLGEDL